MLYYRHGGILQYVLRQLLMGREKAEAVSAGPAAAPKHRPDETSATVDESSRESFPASDAPAY